MGRKAALLMVGLMVIAPFLAGVVLAFTLGFGNMFTGLLLGVAGGSAVTILCNLRTFVEMLKDR